MVYIQILFIWYFMRGKYYNTSDTQGRKQGRMLFLSVLIWFSSLFVGDRSISIGADFTLLQEASLTAASSALAPLLCPSECASGQRTTAQRPPRQTQKYR